MSLSAVSVDNAGTTLADSDVELLSSSLRGPLLRPGQAGYDEARAIYNGMIERRPALIARCAGAADVLAAVRFAKERGLLVSVRGGGHNVTGNALADGGLMIDLSPMKGILVDPTRRTARAQAGLLWGEFDHETQAFGLATTGGISSTTGIAGFTLGGGMGWLSRRRALACDNLLSVDIVTADGQLAKASTSENPDLFWAVRGGGGNFGVVTAFEYQLYPVGPTVLAGMVAYPASEGASVLRRYRDYVTSAPDDLMTIVSMRKAPPVAYLPPSVHGQPIIGILALSCGSLDEGERLMAPLRKLGTLIADTISPKPYVTHQRAIDALFPQGRRNYWKASQMADFGGPAIDTALSHFESVPSQLMSITIWQLGGAVARVGTGDTAYAHRDAQFALNIPSLWSDPAEDERNIRWTRDLFDAMTPYSSGVYVNFLGTEGEDRVKAAYRPDTYDRLSALKRKYDPTNFFRLNQNIKPRRRHVGGVWSVTGRRGRSRAPTSHA